MLLKAMNTFVNDKIRMVSSRRRRNVQTFLVLLVLVYLEWLYAPGFYMFHSVWTDRSTCRPDSCNSCFSHNFTYLIQNSSICKTSGNGRVDLLIVITSVHSERIRRNVVRETWLSISERNSANVRYVFMFGSSKDRALMQTIYEESKVHGDILMEDFADSYLNLTHKTLMGMKWAAMHCPHARFYMKTDQDMWVNVPKIVKMLHTRSEELQQNVGGQCFDSHPVRLSFYKWYTPYTSYPYFYYPTICSGTGYVTSMNVVRRIYGVYRNIPFIEWEDVYVALCLQHLQMGVVNIPGFYRQLVTMEPCTMKSDVLTSHGVSSELLVKYQHAICVT